MTVHQMAKSASVQADQAAADGSELAALERYNAELLRYWSDMIGDMRGRRRRGARFYEHAPPGTGTGTDTDEAPTDRQASIASTTSHNTRPAA